MMTFTGVLAAMVGLWCFATMVFFFGRSESVGSGAWLSWTCLICGCYMMAMLNGIRWIDDLLRKIE